MGYLWPPCLSRKLLACPGDRHDSACQQQQRSLKPIKGLWRGGLLPVEADQYFKMVPDTPRAHLQLGAAAGAVAGNSSSPGAGQAVAGQVGGTGAVAGSSSSSGAGQAVEGAAALGAGNSTAGGSSSGVNVSQSGGAEGGGPPLLQPSPPALLPPGPVRVSLAALRAEMERLAGAQLVLLDFVVSVEEEGRHELQPLLQLLDRHHCLKPGRGGV